MAEIFNRQKEVKEKTRVKKVIILSIFLVLLILFIIIFFLSHYSNDWEKITNNPWKSRGHHQTLVFQDKIWLIGGVTIGTDISKKNQLFINHSLACDDCEGSPWANRGLNLNDVWYSTDGINWTQATSSAQWSPRRGHTSVVYDNKMWIIGGAGIKSWDDNLNDVWYSTDGINWTQATSSAQWNKRSFHSSVVFNNQMWLIGGWGGWGRNYNDVWYSTDGVEWKKNSTNWKPRWGHAVTVHGNKIWLIGGNIHSKNNEEKNNIGDSNDVWYSTDGVEWTKLKKDIPWEPRRAFTSLIFKNNLWIIGGVQGSINERISTYGDIWRLNL